MRDLLFNNEQKVKNTIVCIIEKPDLEKGVPFYETMLLFCHDEEKNDWLSANH